MYTRDDYSLACQYSIDVFCFVFHRTCVLIKQKEKDGKIGISTFYTRPRTRRQVFFFFFGPPPYSLAYRYIRVSEKLAGVLSIA